MTRDEIMRMDAEELRLAIAKAKYPKVEMRWCKRDCECGNNEEYQSIAENLIEMGVDTQEEWEETIRSGEKRVYQWPCWNPRENDEPSWVPVPDWPTSIADAWELVEEIRKKYFSTSVFCWDHNDDWWIDCTPRSGHDEEKEDLTVWAKSFPMLICRAWLMAQEAK